MKHHNGEIPQKILFLCHANVCRSPIAEYLFNDMIANDPILRQIGVRARSAGILKNNCQPPSDQAIMVMQERGLGSISRHNSRQIDHEILINADVILTMEEQEKIEITTRFPEAAKRTFTLSEFAGGSGEIQDPTGGNTERFKLCADIIERYLKNIIFQLKTRLVL